MTTALSITTVVAQNNSQYTAVIAGAWKNGKEALTFRFNTDGTFTMSGEGENAERAARSERWSKGEAAATGITGTCTVTDKVINMSMTVDGKH